MNTIRISNLKINLINHASIDVKTELISLVSKRLDIPLSKIA